MLSIKLIAPMTCAVPEEQLRLLDISPAFEYADGKRTEKIIGLKLLVVDPRTFERFSVRVHSTIHKITTESLEESPVLVRFTNAVVKPYVGQNGRLALSFSADDYEIIDQNVKKI